MPKIKKSKVVSLVAYQSGDESDGADSNETATSESDQSVNEQDVSKRSSDFEIEDPDAARAALKRTRPSVEINDYSVANEEDTLKKTKQDQTGSECSPEISTPEVESADMDVLAEENAQMESEEIVEIATKFTLAKGFPPGCEYIKLPSAPKTLCSQSLQNKIVQVTDRMERFNYNINDDIHRKKSFRNPCIYEKLIEVYGIEEFGSSFPNHTEDLKSSGYMLYDELDAVQRAEWARIEKAKKERTKIEMVSGTKKTSK